MFKRPSDPWFLIPRSIEKPRFRLFCIPYAGGNASAFHKWASKFERDELFAAQLPGRAFRRREPCIRDAHAMVKALLEAMKGYLDVPFVLYGHSMGGLLAFELARALRREGHRLPSALIVSGRRAPQIPGVEAIPHDMPDDRFWTTVGQLYGTTPALLNSTELKEMLLPVFRADFQLLNGWSYSEDEPLSCPIYALGGDEDPGIPSENLEAWDVQTTAGFESKIFQGGHMFIQPREAEFLDELVSILGHIPATS